MMPFAHAFAYAIKKTPYAFFAKITLCMYILCGIMLLINIDCLGTYDDLEGCVFSNRFKMVRAQN